MSEIVTNIIHQLDTAAAELNQESTWETIKQDGEKVKECGEAMAKGTLIAINDTPMSFIDTPNHVINEVKDFSLNPATELKTHVTEAKAVVDMVKQADTNQLCEIVGNVAGPAVLAGLIAGVGEIGVAAGVAEVAIPTLEEGVEIVANDLLKSEQPSLVGLLGEMAAKTIEPAFETLHALYDSVKGTMDKDQPDAMSSLSSPTASYDSLEAFYKKVEEKMSLSALANELAPPQKANVEHELN